MKKNLCIYCIVDEVSESILATFPASSSRMALRQFRQAMEANKDKIYDLDSIKLYMPMAGTEVYDSFCYSVPETFDELSKEFWGEYPLNGKSILEDSTPDISF